MCELWPRAFVRSSGAGQSGAEFWLARLSEQVDPVPPTPVCSFLQELRRLFNQPRPLRTVGRQPEASADTYFFFSF